MKIVITDCDHHDLQEEREVFREAGLSFELLQCRTEKDLIAECGGADILLNQYAPITRRVMEALSSLKFVVRSGVGVNNVDVGAAAELGVQVGNVPNYGMNEVADHALALMMALLRKIPLMNEQTKEKDWNYGYSAPIRRLSTLKAGVVGLGRIGRNFAGKAHALGMEVLGYDPYYTPGEECSFIRIRSLEEIIREADVISLHCPLEQARNLFDRDAFRKMKKSAYLINVSRGGIIDEEALDWALETGEIAGAAIDCFQQEPMKPGAALFRHRNLIATPHMAWYSEEAARELKRKIAEEAVRFASGQTIRYPVNRVEVPRR